MIVVVIQMLKSCGCFRVVMSMNGSNSFLRMCQGFHNPQCGLCKSILLLKVGSYSSHAV